MREVEVVHDANELLLWVRETSIVLLLLCHGRHLMTLVVVADHEGIVIREGKDLIPDGVVKQACVALLEVSPAAASEQKGVARKGNAVRVNHISHAACKETLLNQ